MRARGKPVCKVCGGATRYGNLYCSPAHAKEADATRATHVQQLEAAGFVKHATTANLFVKNGISVSIERAEKIGVAKMIVQHGHAVTAFKGRSDL